MKERKKKGERTKRELSNMEEEKMKMKEKKNEREIFVDGLFAEWLNE